MNHVDNTLRKSAFPGQPNFCAEHLWGYGQLSPKREELLPHESSIIKNRLNEVLNKICSEQGVQLCRDGKSGKGNFNCP